MPTVADPNDYEAVANPNDYEVVAQPAPVAPILRSGAQMESLGAREFLATPESQAAGDIRGTGDQPVIPIPRIPQQEGVVAQLGAGAVNTAANLAETFETPQLIASLPVMPMKLTQLLFGGQALSDIKTAYEEAARPETTIQKGLELGGRALTDALFGVGMVHGAVGGLAEPKLPPPRTTGAGLEPITPPRPANAYNIAMNAPGTVTPLQPIVEDPFHRAAFETPELKEQRIIQDIRAGRQTLTESLFSEQPSPVSESTETTTAQPLTEVPTPAAETPTTVSETTATRQATPIELQNPRFRLLGSRSRGDFTSTSDYDVATKLTPEEYNMWVNTPEGEYPRLPKDVIDAAHAGHDVFIETEGGHAWKVEPHPVSDDPSHVVVERVSQIEKNLLASGNKPSPVSEGGAGTQALISKKESSVETPPTVSRTTPEGQAGAISASDQKFNTNTLKWEPKTEDDYLYDALDLRHSVINGLSKLGVDVKNTDLPSADKFSSSKDFFYAMRDAEGKMRSSGAKLAGDVLNPENTVQKGKLPKPLQVLDTDGNLISSGGVESRHAVADGHTINPTVTGEHRRVDNSQVNRDSGSSAPPAQPPLGTGAPPVASPVSESGLGLQAPVSKEVSGLEEPVVQTVGRGQAAPSFAAKYDPETLLIPPRWAFDKYGKAFEDKIFKAIHNPEKGVDVTPVWKVMTPIERQELVARGFSPLPSRKYGQVILQASADSVPAKRYYNQQETLAQRRLAAEPSPVSQGTKTTTAQPLPQTETGAPTEAGQPEPPSGVTALTPDSQPPEVGPNVKGFEKVYGPGEIKAGDSVTPEEIFRSGQADLASGKDPYAIADRARTGDVSPKEIGLLAAEHDRLLHEAAAAEGTPEYEAKYQQAKDFAQNMLKPAGTKWHQTGMGLQVKAPVDLGSLTGFRAAFEERFGKEMTPDQANSFSQIARDVARAKAEDAVELGRTAERVRQRFKGVKDISFEDAVKSLHDEIATKLKDCNL